MSIDNPDGVEIDGADLAAELDDDPDPTLDDGTDIDDDDAEQTYTGTAHGGRWDGTRVTSRRPKGFLLVDSPARHVWIYDRDDTTGDFWSRTQDPLDLDDDKCWQTADEPDFDILVPGIEGAPE